MVTAQRVEAPHLESIRTRARRVAEAVPDPELPMLTLADLGVLRGVEVDADGTVTASITPTYSGCPAMAEMRSDVAARLRAAGFPEVRIRTVLDPPWTSDWISAEGRRKLAEYGIAPPGPAPRRAVGPVPLTLSPTRRAVACPRCGSSETEETSRFSATSCKALWRCRNCLEPFEHLKEI
ncbi:phenylacetate-CoA oxygenase subunit PaaJ [Streptomyces sp. RB6PN25]|uniref:Phenylacetate-CoA oxygenase subunit PaaJ n=1 Tax=Streptomyces humicola TaxID=2953240 RepID=A0ABT1PXI5_9ACTN|nr:1,2-phenylacetyl-CoA epoxidase subunit PaaD [Streptomyces humicola]MCQ4082391.1 phenylacetate-CoA oxygenase subunit PaaJ [Streptomyces humicola]